MEALAQGRLGRGVLVAELMGLVYFIGCFVSLFPITRVFATDFGTETPDKESIIVGIMMGFCLCWLWPLAIIGVPIYFAVKHWE